MNKENNTETQNRAGSLFLYGSMIFEALVLIALICWLVFSIWWAYKGMDNFVFIGIPKLIVRYILLLLLIPFTIHFIVTIPESVREIQDKERRRSEKYDAIMEGYFVYDKEFRDDMMHILWLMEEEHYSSADRICVKLLEECYIPEKQAAILYCRMICREEMGYTKEAIACGEKAISLRKGFRPALLKTSELCVKINKMTAARQYLQEAQGFDQQDI